MSDRIVAFWNFWSLAIIQGANGYYLACALAFLAFTDGPDYQSDFWKHWRLVVFVTSAGSKFLEGFWNQTIARLSQGRPPAPTGDTSQYWPTPQPPTPKPIQ